MGTKADELKERTAKFAEDVVRLVRGLPDRMECRRMGGQLLDAGTSVAANYRAVCRARSTAEFVSKMGLVAEETDESEFWLGFLVQTAILTPDKVAHLRQEANELLAIFIASHKTASERLKRTRAR